MIRRPQRSTLSSSSAASDVYKRQGEHRDWDEGERTLYFHVAQDNGSKNPIAEENRSTKDPSQVQEIADREWEISFTSKISGDVLITNYTQAQTAMMKYGRTIPSDLYMVYPIPERSL